MTVDTRPLIAHVLHRFAIGGLENGVVNLINHLPEDQFRHVVICVTDHDAGFARRIRRDDVQVFDLHKQAGQDPRVWWRCYRLLRQLRPDIVHTRNLSALEAQLPAFLAGVKRRIHSEHGRDTDDLHGQNRRYRLLRKMLLPLAHQVIALSQELGHYLQDAIGVPARKLHVICNGVDIARFHAATAADAHNGVTFIAVGRLQPVKDPLNILQAFARVCAQRPQAELRLRLLGDGPLLDDCRRFCDQQQLNARVELPGASHEVASELRRADVFVLGSQAEGISNTVLEAMASGLPVVATRVGGNSELVVEGETGFLVPAHDHQQLATAMLRYVDDPALRQRHARAARLRAENDFSLDGMMNKYAQVYLGKPVPAKGSQPCVA